MRLYSSNIQIRALDCQLHPISSAVPGTEKRVEALHQLVLIYQLHEPKLWRRLPGLYKKSTAREGKKRRHRDRYASGVKTAQ